MSRVYPNNEFASCSMIRIWFLYDFLIEMLTLAPRGYSVQFPKIIIGLFLGLHFNGFDSNLPVVYEEL